MGILSGLIGSKQIRFWDLKKLFLQIELQSVRDLNIGYLDCSGSDLASAAGNLEEVAELIEEVGLERLRQVLGINTSLEN